MPNISFLSWRSKPKTSTENLEPLLQSCWRGQEKTRRHRLWCLASMSCFVIQTECIWLIQEVALPVLTAKSRLMSTWWKPFELSNRRKQTCSPRWQNGLSSRNEHRNGSSQYNRLMRFMRWCRPLSIVKAELLAVKSLTTTKWKSSSRLSLSQVMFANALNPSRSQRNFTSSKEAVRAVWLGVLSLLNTNCLQMKWSIIAKEWPFAEKYL